ncbi:MAG: hypothetical protein FJ278_24520, partial [Planctomycetes bacterium]|nr:hypothetical protein [Planctomycetota bacterium]
MRPSACFRVVLWRSPRDPMKREAGVAERYGEALLTVAEKLGQVESISSHLKMLKAVLDAHPRLMAFLASPQIAAAEKRRLVRATLGQTLPATLV